MRAFRIIACLAIVAVVANYACIFLYALWTWGLPPKWSYGEGKFMRFKSVANRTQYFELRGLLEEEKPQEFNRRRKELGLDNRYLLLKDLRLIGKDLAGVNLSRCILTGCNFTGSDLRGASFKKSYVAQTAFCEPLSLESGPITPKMARMTDLSGAQFDGATVEATVYYMIEFGYTPMTSGPGGLTFCKLSNNTGLPVPAPVVKWDLPVELTPDGVRASMAPSRRITNFSDVSIPCANPFQDIPASALDQWRQMGVDVQSLKTKSARRLDSSRLTVGTHRVVNSDSNVVVVLTELHNSWSDVLSTGPIVAMNNANGMHNLISDNVLWIRDEASLSMTVVGHPIVFSADSMRSLGRALLSPMYIWSENDRKERGWMKRLLAETSIEEVARMVGHAPKLIIQPTNSPPDLNALVGERRARSLVQKHPEIQNAQLAIASGAHFGSSWFDLVQPNPNVILVLDRGFAAHGGVFAAGPIVIAGGGQVDPILSQSWIDGIERKYHPALSLK